MKEQLLREVFESRCELHDTRYEFVELWRNFNGLRYQLYETLREFHETRYELHESLRKIREQRKRYFFMLEQSKSSVGASPW